MSNQKGQVGHSKTVNGERVKFLHGTGCLLFPDCLSCPLPDCVYPYKGSTKKGLTNNVRCGIKGIEKHKG